MKKTCTLLIALTCVSIQPGYAEKSSLQKNEERRQAIANHYNDAEKAFARGDKKSTVLALRKALAINPNHGPSRALALKLKKNSPRFLVKARKRQLSKVIIPVIDFDQTPLSDALSILGTLVEEKSENTVIPNFVIQDLSETLQKRPVTLSMKNVPADVVLDYLTNLTHSKASYNAYAITVRPLSP